MCENNKIGRLWGFKFYLCGSMDRVSKEEATEWRDDLSIFLYNLGCIPLNPCDKPIDVNPEIESKELRENLKSQFKFDELSQQIKENIRQPDLRLCDISDALIVNLDIDTQMCGTYEEIFLCNRMKMPILIMCPQGIENIPDWLYGTLPNELFFSSWKTVKSYLVTINNWNFVNPPTFRRWVWIDYYKLIKPLIERLN